MTRLPGWQEQMRAAKRENADFFYLQEGDWTRMQGTQLRHAHCRFSVKQEANSPAAVADAEAVARQAGAAYTDIRTVKVHPDDGELEVGMVLSVQAGGKWGPVAWDGGRLEIVARGQPGKLSRQRTYRAVLRR